MNPNLIPLESLQIAKPCRADWGAMSGDERARFCASCRKNVYDLSAMTRAEAEALILEKEGNLCLRLYRRQDGTVITSDCPVGIAVPRRPLRWVGAALAAILGLVASWTARPAQARPPLCADAANSRAVMGKIAVTMGAPAPPPQPTPLPNSANRLRPPRRGGSRPVQVKNFSSPK